MEGRFMRCLLQTSLVFAVLQSILIAGTHGSGPGFSDDCQRELAFCIYRVSVEYLVLGNEEALAKARSTPLDIHCKDWNEAMECDRRQLASDVCQNVTSAAADRVIKIIKVIDLAVDYTCKKHFIRLNRIYRCILDSTVFTTVTDGCKAVEFNATNVCEKIPDLIRCTAEGLTSRCGADAGNVARELGPPLWEALVEATYDRKCSPSKSDDLTSLIKRFFSRK